MSSAMRQSSGSAVIAGRAASAAVARGVAQAQSALGDEALIGRIADGDQTALAALYDRFGAIAFGLALRVARDSTFAEEAVQDAFLSVWRSASKFDRKRGSARTWLLMLVHRRAVDLVKRSARRREQPVAIPPEEATVSIAESAEVRAERRRVQAALQGLPTRQRQALELAYYGGYSQSEIARMLSVPVGTIKSRMYGGLGQLREHLRDPDSRTTPTKGDT